jgi:hypothetical protein
MKSKIKVTLSNIYIALEIPKSTNKIKYAEPIFIGHAPRM